MKMLILALILFTHSAYAEEAALIKSCTKKDLPACERLGAFYIKLEKWEKALIVGKALCDKDIPIGCTYSGLSLMAQNKAREGNSYLTKACDKFEPFACRSLGRLMKSGGEAELSHMYFRRACHYGLKDICSDLKKGKKVFSKAGVDYIKKVQEDCADTQASSCSDRLSSLSRCLPPLEKLDCLLIPGHLSIYFRAKLMQSEAKFSLLSLVAAQKILKNDPKINKYSYDLEVVLKGYKPLSNYHYVFGFMNACAGKEKTNTLSLYPESYSNLNTRIKVNIRNYFAKGKRNDCYDTKGGFEAFAVANLDPLNPSRLDVWKINHDGNLLQVADGLPLP